MKKKMTFGEFVEKKLSYIDPAKLNDHYEAYQAYLQVPEKKSLKWEDVIMESKVRYYIRAYSKIEEIKGEFFNNSNLPKSAIPTREFAERELARMQWAMVADAANEGKEPVFDGQQNYYYIIFNYNQKTFGIGTMGNLASDPILFLNKEKLEQAIEENRDIVNKMFGI